MVSQIHAVPSSPSSFSLNSGFLNRRRPNDAFLCSRLLSSPPREAGRLNRTFVSMQHGQALLDEEGTVFNVEEPAYCSWIPHRPMEPNDLGGWSAIVGFSSSESSSLKGFAGYMGVGAGLILMISLVLVSFKAFCKPELFERGLAFLTKEEQYSKSLAPALFKSKEELTRQRLGPITIKEDDFSGIANAKAVGRVANGKVPECVPRLVRPACDEPMHDEALSKLQILKIVETGYQSSELCTRREYARWLVLASNILARKPSQRVLPAVHVEGGTSLAFDDVLLEDPDFPYIQGLAEAGFIASKLDSNSLNNDAEALASADIKSTVLFLPDSYISRQEVVSWKAILEHPFYWKSEEKVVEAKVVYIDMEGIHAAARPALVMDLLGEEESIAASAFGYSRRLQPDYPVTKGQAAMAIISGRMAEALSEEITKVEAENLIDKQRLKELVSEAHAKMEQDDGLKELLASSKEARSEVEKLAEAKTLEAGLSKAVCLNETLLYHKQRAAIESERKLLSRLGVGLVEQGRLLSIDLRSMQLEKPRLEKLKDYAKKQKHDLQGVRLKLEAEMRAVASVRMWTEGEARRALAYGNMLMESKKRWGIRESSDCQPAEREAERGLVKGTLQSIESNLYEVLQFSKQAYGVAKQTSMSLLADMGVKFLELQLISTLAFRKFYHQIAAKFSCVICNLARSLLVDGRKLKG